MKVTLIASTTILPKSGLPEGPPYVTDQWLPRHDDPDLYSMEDDADWLAEFAGRACYESWNRPNPLTARNADYLRNILARQHFSVLEHASATFYVENVSRTLTHELVRHRHLSYSQRSQRYVDESLNVGVIPDAMRAISDARLGNDQTVREAVQEQQDRSLELYQQIRDILHDRGHTWKEARGAARAVLLANSHTSIVVTGNHRAWRDMLGKRWHVAAENEIRKLAGLILLDLINVAPNVYQDFDPNRPIGTPATDA